MDAPADVEQHSEQAVEESGRVRVCVRIRPEIPTDFEASYLEPYSVCVEVSAESSNAIVSRPFLDSRKLRFDHVIGPDADQGQTFKIVGEPIVEKFTEGMNGTIFAYGMTGSGKTHTIIGNALDRTEEGLLPRAIRRVFESMDASKCHYDLKVSAVQLYREKLTDLLDCRTKRVTIREDKKNGVFLEGASAHIASTPAQTLEMLFGALRQRVTAQTKQNHSSSRSHAIITMKLEQWEPMEEGRAKECEVSVRNSQLTIVDLAGSERVSKSGSEGIRLEESKNINKSISALGNCIAALAERCRSGNDRHHVPFRDSVLTRLLTNLLAVIHRQCSAQMLALHLLLR